SSLFEYNENMEQEPSKSFSQPSFPKNEMSSNANENKVTSEVTLMSDLTTPVTRAEQVNIDGVVNVKMLHSHLAMLAKFKSLEQQDSVIDERYLLRAERRYLLWLKLLNNESFKDDDDVPIPPIEHIDERSKQFWEKNTNQPWVLDPNDTSDFELVCPTANGEYNKDKAISDSDYLFDLTSAPWKDLLEKIKE
ncbi:10226_t:CDS:2, partial [Racocetra fulgida]